MNGRPDLKAERRRRRLLLEQRIRESRLAVRVFASDVLLCDERTVRRWLKEEQTVSNVVTEFLEDPRPRAWPAPIARDVAFDVIAGVLGEYEEWTGPRSAEMRRAWAENAADRINARLTGQEVTP